MAVLGTYVKHPSKNTIKTQRAALDGFSHFLASAKLLGFTGEELQTSPLAWRGVTWGIVQAFVKWMLNKEYAVSTINNRLTVVRVYAGLAGQAGEIPITEIALIKTVKGYGDRHARHVDEKREAEGIGTRNGRKKATHTQLSKLDYVGKQKDWWLTTEYSHVCQFIESARASAWY